MLFNSYEFLFVFLPLVVFGYYLFGRLRLTIAARLYLLAASFFFYGYWNVNYLVLIVFSILINYGICLLLWQGRWAKPMLVCGLAFNLLLLGVFKYTDMALQTTNYFFSSQLPLMHLTLPLAISFFTFQQVACLVDTYRGQTQPCPLYKYALFVSFFPQLIAGPIVHFTEMVPQFRRLRSFVFSHRQVTMGLGLFFMGLFKKAVIADGIAAYVGPVFGAPAEGHLLTFLEAWGGALAYTFQIYFDFSGYTDMAIGLGRMFNVRLPVNFNSPYKSTSIQEFWRRWHITLSRFLRDYLYIPLGGNRCRLPRQFGNLMVTMLLGGLWHGASWTFVLWGGIHGLMLAIQRVVNAIFPPMPRLIAWALTFTALVFTWVLFRADDLDTAFRIYEGMLGLNGFALPQKLMDKWGAFAQLLADQGVVFKILKPYWERGKEIQHLLVCLLIVLAMPNTREILDRYFRPTRRWAAAFAVCAAMAIFSLTRISEFLYFRF